MIARTIRVSALVALAGGLLVGGSLLVPAIPTQAADPAKVCLAHSTGVNRFEGKFEYIIVDNGKLSGHDNHGDFISLAWTADLPCNQDRTPFTVLVSPIPPK